MKYLLLSFILFTLSWGQYTSSSVRLLPNPTLYSFVGSDVHQVSLHKSNVVSKPKLHINHHKSTNIPKSDLYYISKLILPKGKYTFHGISYDLNQEGLHRIIDFQNKDSLQIIIFNDDVIKLLSAFSWMVKHGNRDDKKSFSKLNAIAQKGNMSLTCGPISNYVHKHLKSLGIKSRLIHFFRNKNFNTYDNGHILLEVKIDGSWVLVDIDNNSIFMDDKQKYLSAFDVATQHNSYKHRVNLSNDSAMDSMHFHSKDKKVNFTFYTENYTLDQWYDPIMKVLFIYDKVKLPLCTDDMDWQAITKYYRHTKCLDKQEFYKQNYGVN